MKAIVYKKTGPPAVLQIIEVEKPVPKDKEILIRVHAATVTSGDVNLRNFKFPALFWLMMRLLYGAKKPARSIPGSEFAGDIEAVGNSVKRFAVGEQVFGSTGMRFGANAEYVCVPEDGIVAAIPPNVTYEQAAGAPFGALSALYFLRKGNIRPGQRVLILGASGGVGTFAVQLARHFGAQVIGVCSALNVAMVQSLGADRVIDYTQEDFTESSEHYDLIFDAVGKYPASRCKQSLAPGGAYATVTSGLARERLEDLIFIKELLEVGELKAVIDRRYPLEQIAEAHRYVEKGRKVGSVVITIGPGDKKSVQEVRR